MIKFLGFRILQSIVVLFCILTITFFLVRMAPGSPFTEDKAIPAHVLEKMRAYYGVDQPLHVQYFKYMINFAQLDLGESFGNKGYTVLEIITESFPVSAAIGLGGLFFALIIGITTGLLAAAKKNSLADYSAMTVAMVGICLPTFIIGPIFAILFGLKLDWFPTSGWWVPWRDWFLPSLTMGLFYGGYIARLTRAGMLDVLNQDFIRTAHAKGLAPSRVLFVHGLKGGLLPVVNFLGPAIAGMIGGSFVMETIFQLPGLGQHFINAASNRDIPLIMGTVATFSLLILVMNFLADMVLVYLNPRLRTGSSD